jgi:hypothetical protein
MNIPLDQLREIFYVFAEFVWSQPPSTIAEMRTKDKGDKGGRSGTMQAINDSLVLLGDSERRAVVDKELKRRGLPSVARLSLAKSRKYTQILRRGTIRNETEFDLLKDLVDEPLLSEAERSKVAMILELYETGS